MEERKEYVIDVPLDEITCKGVCLGEESNKVYFKIDDGRYAIINQQEIVQTDKNRINLKGNLDIRPNMYFLSKKDKSIIERFES